MLGDADEFLRGQQGGSVQAWFQSFSNRESDSERRRTYSELARAALALVLTRVFDPPLPDRVWGGSCGDTGPAIIPVFDVLNHAPRTSPACNVRYEAGPLGDAHPGSLPPALRVVARTDVDPGAELRQDYGHDGAVTLLTHGFVDGFAPGAPLGEMIGAVAAAAVTNEPPQALPSKRGERAA